MEGLLMSSINSPALNVLSGDHGVVILGGVSGSGMIGLARMCLQKGVKVIGCDRQKTDEVATLESGGLMYFNDNDPVPVEDAALVVCSSALKQEHPLRQWAKANDVPVAGRAEMLAALLHDREVILVVGTHGKTTSAVLMAHALRKLGRDVSFYIGAEVPLFGTSAYLGQDVMAVIEADESDGSFTHFNPAHVLVLNIEEDHLDHYSGLAEITDAFRSVLERCEGQRVICADDEVARNTFSDLNDTVLYGFNQGANMQGSDWNGMVAGSVFSADFGEGAKYEVEVALNGQHNALNVLGVASLCVALGFDPQAVSRLFADVRGARRRFEVLSSNKFGTVVDDYAHHPTEIQATIKAARNTAAKRLVAVFQPHRFSRTEKLMDRFAGCFEGADVVHITDVYGAGEISHSDNVGRRLSEEVAAAHPHVAFHTDFTELKNSLRKEWQPEDTLLVMGAGNVNEIARTLATEVQQADEISKLLGDEGECLLYEPMSKHTTLRVGGPVDAWVNVSSEAALAKTINYAKTRTKPMVVIGRGTNLLVKDGGIRGICCHLKKGDFNRMEFNGERIYCGAGVRLKNLVAEAKKRDLGGLEFMEGIPGNVGGALRMNAGAMQSWTFEVVESVRIMDPMGIVHEVAREDIEVKYRQVPVLVENIALGATVRVVVRDRSEVNEIIKSYSEKRWKSQPPKPSAGCSFKNPNEIPAGKLIEELGLKGKKIGGATISTVHGNFIVNDRDATAEDVLALIDLVKEEVKEKRGITLETEVIILGE
jgi:UDP-N-acetylmuramate--L-alanine ligase/UDP-N-acetylenolpyruvoylglucosamine reductase